MSQLSQLRELNIAFCRAISDAGVRHLENLYNLQKFTANNNSIYKSVSEYLSHRATESYSWLAPALQSNNVSTTAVGLYLS